MTFLSEIRWYCSSYHGGRVSVLSPVTLRGVGAGSSVPTRPQGLSGGVGSTYPHPPEGWTVRPRSDPIALSRVEPKRLVVSSKGRPPVSVTTEPSPHVSPGAIHCVSAPLHQRATRVVSDGTVRPGKSPVEQTEDRRCPRGLSSRVLLGW